MQEVTIKKISKVDHEVNFTLQDLTFFKEVLKYNKR